MMMLASNPDPDAELGPFLPLVMVPVEEVRAAHLAHVSVVLLVSVGWRKASAESTL